jgi:tRNA dimethylallyltransferase
MEEKRKPLLIVLLGPTAVGKTKVAIGLANHFNTCVLSSDSRQFYKQMDIGTAKPGAEELAAAAHHFIGFLDINENYSAGKFEKDALDFLDEHFKSNEVAVMAGGSGLYAEAVCEGFDALPSDDLTRQNLIQLFEEQGLETLQSMLYEADPVYYDMVDRKNPQRIIRALEVIKLSGKPYSEQRSGKTASRHFNCIKIALDMPRELLNARMMKDGLLEEVKSLYNQRELNALKSVGYQELFDYLDGKCTLEEAIAEIQKNTRRFAKRQLTWLRRMPDLHWVNMSSDDRAVKEICKLVEDYIAGQTLQQSLMQE